MAVPAEYRTARIWGALDSPNEQPWLPLENMNILTARISLWKKKKNYRKKKKQCQQPEQGRTHDQCSSSWDRTSLLCNPQQLEWLLRGFNQYAIAGHMLRLKRAEICTEPAWHAFIVSGPLWRMLHPCCRGAKFYCSRMFCSLQLWLPCDGRGQPACFRFM